MNYEQMMKDFHVRQRQPIGVGGPLRTIVPWAERFLRMRLIFTEAAELADAIGVDDKVEIADALADLMYVVIGTAVTFGIPLDECFAEVHRSNMTKSAPDEREAGMKGGIKGPNFEKPQILKILEHQQRLVDEAQGLIDGLNQKTH